MEIWPGLLQEKQSMSRLLFRLTAFATTAFVITILAMVAMLLGDPIAPVNVWFNHHGGAVLVIEVLAIVLLGLAAMIVDRRDILREQAKPLKTDQTQSDEPS
jgi:succinate dehydrogenase hydrophobic anchor subunit